MKFGKLTFTAVLSVFVFAANSQGATAPRGVRVARGPAAATATTTSATYSASDAGTSPTYTQSGVNTGNGVAPSAGEHRHAPVNFDGFIDAQAKLPSRRDLSDHGFTLNDAALYIARDYATGSAFVELPFYGSTADNSFVFATVKSQAVVQKNYNNLGFRLGQYASFFGEENNDSINRMFADAGLMKTLGIVPYTHTGAQAVFTMNQLSFRGQIANPNSMGTMANMNPEVGVNGRFDSGAAFGALGIEYGQTYQDIANKTNLLIEVMGGATAAKFTFGGQIDFKKTQGFDRQGLGIEFLGTFQYTDALAFGARIDYAKDMVYGVSPFATDPNFADTHVIDNAFELAVGPSYKFENDLTLRGDVSYLSLKEPTRDERSAFWLALSLVARL